jgi:hypothetical protein
LLEKANIDLSKDYSRLLEVRSLQELFKAALSAPEEVNVILWRRGELSGDFNGLARYMEANPSEPEIAVATPLYLPDYIKDKEGLSEDILKASRQVIADLKMFKEDAPYKMSPDLRLITKENDDRSTDEFHLDGGKWRLMCCYNEPVTEWVRNEDVIGYEELNIQIRPGTEIFTFMPGDVWMHACQDTGKQDLFIHRGHTPELGEPPRLLTVVDKFEI